LPEDRRYAAVIGPGRCDERTAQLSHDVGRGLAAAGFILVTGGEYGAMEAASRGASEAGGMVVGLLPGTDRTRANRFSDVTVVTGIGHARNLGVVASADVVVAVGGEWGTLSEIGFAGVLGRPVVLLAGWRLEHASRMPSEVHYADTAAEAVALAESAATRTGGISNPDRRPGPGR
jgi:uncharacterized protein (TIGR00725 family)